MNNNHRRLIAPFLLLGLVSVTQVAAQDAPRAGGESALASDYSEKGADTCLGCHSVEPFFSTKHARREDSRTPFAGLQCEACHGPGGKHAKGMAAGQMVPIMNFGAKSKQNAAQQNKPCLGCHERDARIEWKGSQHEAGDLAPAATSSTPRATAY